MVYFYEFAGTGIEVVIPDEIDYDDSRLLRDFRTESCANPHRFVFEVRESLRPPAGERIECLDDFWVYREEDRFVRYIGTSAKGVNGAYMRVEHRKLEHYAQLRGSRYSDRIGVKTVLTALSAEHLVVQAGGVVFHCSYIEHEGEAILFTAPSGTGKSTQADLWNQLRGTTIINGDRAAIRVVDGRVFACGIPFAGSSEHCLNRTMPLKAIVYLAQAPETTIRSLRGYEAFSRIWEGCSVNTWDPEDMALASDTVARVANTVPVFYLPCTPDESAVIALEQALKGER